MTMEVSDQQDDDKHSSVDHIDLSYVPHLRSSLSRTSTRGGYDRERKACNLDLNSSPSLRPGSGTRDSGYNTDVSPAATISPATTTSRQPHFVFDNIGHNHIPELEDRILSLSHISPYVASGNIAISPATHGSHSPYQLHFEQRTRSTPPLRLSPDIFKVCASPGRTICPGTRTSSRPVSEASETNRVQFDFESDNEDDNISRRDGINSSSCRITAPPKTTCEHFEIPDSFMGLPLPVLSHDSDDGDDEDVFHKNEDVLKNWGVMSAPQIQRSRNNFTLRQRRYCSADEDDNLLGACGGRDPNISEQNPSKSDYDLRVGARYPIISGHDSSGSCRYPISNSHDSIIGTRYPIISGHDSSVHDRYPISNSHDSIIGARYPIFSGHDSIIGTHYPSASGHDSSVSGRYPNISGQDSSIATRYPNISSHDSIIGTCYPSISDHDTSTCGDYPIIDDHDTSDNMLFSSSSQSLQGTNKRRKPHRQGYVRKIASGTELEGKSSTPNSIICKPHEPSLTFNQDFQPCRFEAYDSKDSDYDNVFNFDTDDMDGDDDCNTSPSYTGDSHQVAMIQGRPFHHSIIRAQLRRISVTAYLRLSSGCLLPWSTSIDRTSVSTQTPHMTSIMIQQILNTPLPLLNEARGTAATNLRRRQSDGGVLVPSGLRQLPDIIPAMRDRAMSVPDAQTLIRMQHAREVGRELRRLSDEFHFGIPLNTIREEVDDRFPRIRHITNPVTRVWTFLRRSLLRRNTRHLYNRRSTSVDHPLQAAHMQLSEQVEEVPGD